MAEDMDFVMDDDDGILDYDDGDDLDFSTDNEEEDEESVIEPPQHPQTPEERIMWQEQIRMIHLRSHLNQLAEKVKHANYIVDKTREELKKCRAHMHHLESERDSMFRQIQQQESDGNQSAVYRLRATHVRLCQELEEEQKLETKILERLDQAEYDLAVVEVEQGKFILVEDDLLRQEQQLARDKTHAALERLHKEKSLASQARKTRLKDARRIAESAKEQEQRHKQALEDADRSHERASKYLHRTLEKMRERQQQAEERHEVEMQRKMDMLVKLKADISSNKENLKAIRARDKAAENAQKEAEEAERRRILEAGGNPDQVMLIKKRQLQQELKRQQFENQQRQQQMEMIDRILTEERRLKKRRKRQPQLWGDPKWEKSLRVPPHKTKPIKFFEDYVKSTTEGVDPASAKPLLRSVTADEEEKRDAEKDYIDAFPSQEYSTDSSEAEQDEAEVEDLAKPEFEGLWEQHKPYKVPKDVSSAKPPGASKMDKEILQRTLEKHREGIVVKQVAAGKEFSGCPFYSKPDIIHFKDFDVGCTYKKRVVLTNVSYSINYCKFLDITERLKDFIKIEFNPPGQMSAGMTCEMLVTFKPMINEDLVGEVNFLSQTGPFSIPLTCTTKKCDLHLDVGMIDFGTTVIGETIKRSFTLSNRGALGTKFDFFKVTGMKQRTLTTAGTSLGRLTTASMRGVSPDSELVPDKLPDKSKQGGSTTDKGADSKKRSQDDLEKIPEAPGEGGLADLQQAEGSEVTDLGMAMEAPTEGAGGSEQKAEQELGDAISPDLAVSEVEDYNLDGMRVGPVVTGEIGPFSSVRLDIIWQPTIPGKVDSEFLVTFADPLSDGLSVRTVANAIDVPVWVERQTVDLKICMFDRLYQDTIVVNNRATTALRLKFEVCKELRNHLEILPKTGYIQAQSQFSAQLKFLPRKWLFEEAEKYFDRDTGVLEAPMIIRVADQTTPVPFTVNAVVTNSDLEFDVKDIDFGYCTVFESARTIIKLTNKSILPQQFGFVGLPEYMEVQPNDGFGTLLPLETLELDVIFSPQKAFDYKFELVCKSLINRDFKISCVGVGVLPPLQLSHQVVHLAATALYDVSTAAFHVLNNHTSSNEFTHPVPRIGTKGEICPVGPTSFEFVVPEGVPLTISPAVGTIEPGKKSRIQLRFNPRLKEDEVRQEAVRLATKMETVRAEKEYEEALKHERELADQAQKAAAKGGKPAKGNQTSPGRAKGGKPGGAPTVNSGSSTVSKPRLITPPDPNSIATDSPEYKGAIGSLLRQFKGSFRTVVIPCYVASGATGNPGELPYSIHNTLYLEVHCPVVKPELVVISDNGSTVVDFGDVSIGQHTSRSITIQNISDRTVELTSSILNTGGPFLMLNALRVLSPGATHTMIISFTPNHGRIFREMLEVRTDTSVLHLTLAGHGVSPVVSLSVENKLFDVGAVLVNEYCEKVFKIQNTSSLAIDYVIKLDSLSLLRHAKAQSLPHFLRPDASLKHFVGEQNFNGHNVFDFVPSEGTISAGESKEVTVTFAPDHESPYYSDGVHIELFSQEESHFFQVRGQARPHIMFLEGGDPLYPDIQSLGVTPSTTEGEEDPKSQAAPIPMLFTLTSQTKDEAFLPATRDVFVCCVRTMAVSQKKNGEFQFENLQPLIQKGFGVEPPKGMVEAGAKRPVTITWTPPQGHDPSKTVEETVLVTLRGDITEQYQLMLRAMVVSE